MEEIDIWRSAKQLIVRYGDQARFEATKRADYMLERGDVDGQRVWFRIYQAVIDLTAASQSEAKH